MSDCMMAEDTSSNSDHNASSQTYALNVEEEQDIQVIPGLTSSRPELGTRPRSVINQIQSHWQDEQAPSKKLQRLVSSCQRAIGIEIKVEQQLHDTCPEGLKSLLHTESTLLDLACECHGVLFGFILQVGPHVVVRHVEGGVFKGFMEEKGLKMIAEQCGKDMSSVLPWCTYTELDIKEQKEHRIQRAASIRAKRTKTANPKPRNRSAHVYSTLLRQLQGKLAILKRELEGSESPHPDEYPCLGFFVKLIRQNERNHRENDVFLFLCGDAEEYQPTLERLLQEYRDVGAVNTRVAKPLQELCCLPNPETIQDQFRLLGQISNNHWSVFPVANRRDGKLSSKDTGISILQHIIFRDEGLSHLPTSLRNRLLYFIKMGELYEAQKLLRYHLSPDSFVGDVDAQLNKAVAVPDEAGAGPDVAGAGPDEAGALPPPKRRRRTAHVDRGSLQQHLPQTVSNMSAVHEGLYGKFKTQIIECGTLFWRLHTSKEDVLVLNDYNCATGEFVKFTYAYITRHSNADNEPPVLSCSCATYSVIKSVANVDHNTVLIGASCMHCRFFREEIEPSFHRLFPNTLTPETNINRKLIQSMNNLKDAVVELPGCQGRKFSVRSEESVTFVHLSRDCKFVSCTKGECKALQKHHKSSEKLATLESSDELCGHLEVMRCSQEVWRSDNDRGSGAAASEVVNQDSSDGEHSDNKINDEVLETNAFLDCEVEQEPDIGSTIKKKFNVLTGKWDFGGRSSHKPADEFSIKLSKCVRKRNQIVDPYPGASRNQAGYLTGPPLVPNVDRSATCECGRGYVDEEHPDGLQPEYDFTTTLYTRTCPVKCDVMKRRCLGGSCVLEYSSSQDCIHFWTKETCAGDEIGWDFVRRVTIAKITFSAFCQDITSLYRSSHLASAKFMSRSTFVDWWFSWAASLNIEFREACSFCGSNPKFLACDGTHVGLSFRNLKVVPIEKPDTDEKISPMHRRNDRCFLFYPGNDADAVRKARSTLQLVCKARLESLNEDSPSQEDLDNLLACCPEPVENVVEQFVSRSFPSSVDRCFADVFKILATDVSVIAFLPFRFLGDMSRICDAGRTQDIGSMRGYAPELHALLRSASGDESSLQKVFCLIRYLVKFLHDVHDDDVVRRAPESILNTYDPESGVAYYFTGSGNKVRQLPRYVVDDTKGECKKHYPKVSSGGFSYMFLWFCPLHGHCYGYHLIPGAEGRKDPFSSLYCYLPEPPLEVFYDNACQLFEYSMMREPGMFKSTRFWHDIFHGFTHKCPKVFRSSRISGMEVVDSEICEQFNSYIQCIKYTASHLNQSHFSFFMQLMIHLWNSKKKDSYSKKLQVAILGCE